MGKSEKLDLYAQNKNEYTASSKNPQLVQTQRAKYLTITGQGEPGGDVFQGRVGGLYGVAFTIKMTRKFAGKGDYKVAPLEGLWWAKGEPEEFWNRPRKDWRWKLLVRTPDFVSGIDLQAARKSLRDKGKPPEFEEVTLESFEEGQVVQMLHIGLYTEEERTLARMKEFLQEHGLTIGGRHHEIYISDPRRTRPERLKTILRWPVQPA
jgi:hypothetical protein